MKALSTAAMAALVATILVACPGFGDEEVEGVFVSSPENLTVTYEKHIARIDEHYCNYCHTPGSGRAPDNRPLHLYEHSSTFAPISLGRIQSTSAPMPPASENNPMSAIDQAYYQRWIDCGRPINDEDAACETQDGGNNGDGNNGGAVTFEDVEAIFANACNFSGCHGGAPAEELGSQLNLETFDAAVLSIRPCDPAQSSLVDRINRDVADPLVMPLGAKLDPESIALIETWVREGEDVVPLCE